MLDNTIPSVDDEYIRSNPLHVLLIRVLERAIRDLNSHSKLVRSETIHWFCVWENALPHAISYKDIRDHVDLDVEYVRSIRYTVDKAMRKQAKQRGH
jgi:hypothetical protein